MIENKTPLIFQSEWDSVFFGLSVAKCSPAEIHDVDKSIKWAMQNKANLLIARCETTNFPVIHRLEKKSFLLMDTFVRYRYVFAEKTIENDDGVCDIRPFKSSDIDAIRLVAKRSFKDYFSHFNNDPGLDEDKCDQLYEIWAQNSCLDKILADDVLVACLDNYIVGFATLKGINKNSIEGVLFGVDPSAQGKGVYRSLMLQAMKWSQRNRYLQMEVDSQIFHYAVQRVWQRLGFEIYTSGHTFHKWLK